MTKQELTAIFRATLTVFTAAIMFALLVGIIIGQAFARDEQELPAAAENNDILSHTNVTLDELPDYKEFTTVAFHGCCNGAVGKCIPGMSVISGSDLPLNTQLEISGVGLFTVNGRDSAIGNNCIAIYFDNHDEAEAFEEQKVKVRIYE